MREGCLSHMDRKTSCRLLDGKSCRLNLAQLRLIRAQHSSLTSSLWWRKREVSPSDSLLRRCTTSLLAWQREVGTELYERHEKQARRPHNEGNINQLQDAPNLDQQNAGNGPRSHVECPWVGQSHGSFRGTSSPYWRGDRQVACMTDAQR